MKVNLARQVVHIEAPRELVFQMLSAIGKGSLPGSEGESSRVVERQGDTIIAEFFSRSGKRVYRTLEEVRLFPPERITFHHIEGPLVFSQEAFILTEADGGTDFSYFGEVECRIRFMPGIGWLTAVTYVKPKYNALIRNHMAGIKAAAEARAARSHVFRRPPTGKSAG